MNPSGLVLSPHFESKSLSQQIWIVSLFQEVEIVPIGLPLSDELSPLVEAPRKNPKVTLSILGFTVDVPPAHRLLAQPSIMLIVILNNFFYFLGKKSVFIEDHL